MFALAALEQSQHMDRCHRPGMRPLSAFDLHASSLTAGRAAQIACVVPLLLALGSQWLQERYRVRDVNHIGARMRIYPPALRLRGSETVEDYFKRAATLRTLADKRLIDALANDPAYDDK